MDILLLPSKLTETRIEAICQYVLETNKKVKNWVGLRVDLDILAKMKAAAASGNQFLATQCRTNQFTD
jgi:hypothetical protein